MQIRRNPPVGAYSQIYMQQICNFRYQLQEAEQNEEMCKREGGQLEISKVYIWKRQKKVETILVLSFRRQLNKPPMASPMTPMHALDLHSLGALGGAAYCATGVGEHI